MTHDLNPISIDTDGTSTDGDLSEGAYDLAGIADDTDGWACNSDMARAADYQPVERPRFTPNYTPQENTRILRAKLHADDGGVATVTFRGTLDGHALWIAGPGMSGRLSVYAEVTRVPDAEPVQTTLKVALVPTGKRVPKIGWRIGSRQGTHVYLLEATVSPMPVPADADADRLDDPAPAGGWQSGSTYL